MKPGQAKTSFFGSANIESIALDLRIPALTLKSPSCKKGI